MPRGELYMPYFSRSMAAENRAKRRRLLHPHLFGASLSSLCFLWLVFLFGILIWPFSLFCIYVGVLS